jgi:outer membrane protein assembly factor BamB
MRRGARMATIAGAIGLTLLLGAATPQARQVYAPIWRTSVVPAGPCLLSAFVLPSEAERCISWTRRETAGPAFHAATGILIVGGSDRRLRGISARDGAAMWSVPMPGAVVAQPTIVEDGAYVGTDDGHVLRADVTSGRIRWDVTVDAEVSEPVVIDDELVLVVTGADTLYALNRLTGEPAWSHKHPLPRGITLRGQSKPLVATVDTLQGPRRRVFVGHASGRLTVLERDTGTVVDELSVSGDDTFGDLDADPFEQEGRIVFASQTRGVIALDPRTGNEAWRNPESGIVRLARGGRHLVIAAGPGKVLGLDAVNGAVRWRFTFDKGAPTRIVVKGGRVHVGSDRGSFYVLDLFSGRPRQYLGTGLGFAADPALWNDMLYVTTIAGEVIALSNAFRGLVQARR